MRHNWRDHEVMGELRAVVDVWARREMSQMTVDSMLDQCPGAKCRMNVSGRFSCPVRMSGSRWTKLQLSVDQVVALGGKFAGIQARAQRKPTMVIRPISIQEWLRGARIREWIPGSRGD